MDIKYDVIFTFDVCAQTGAVQAVPPVFVNCRQIDRSETRVTLC